MGDDDADGGCCTIKRGSGICILVLSIISLVGSIICAVIASATEMGLYAAFNWIHFVLLIYLISAASAYVCCRACGSKITGGLAVGYCVLAFVTFIVLATGQRSAIKHNCEGTVECASISDWGDHDPECGRKTSSFSLCYLPETDERRRRLASSYAPKTDERRRRLATGCRSDICTDIGNDCCAPGGEARGCSIAGYEVQDDWVGSSGYGECVGTYGQESVYQCCGDFDVTCSLVINDHITGVYVDGKDVTGSLSGERWPAPSDSPARRVSSRAAATTIRADACTVGLRCIAPRWTGPGRGTACRPTRRDGMRPTRSPGAVGYSPATTTAPGRRPPWVANPSMGLTSSVAATLFASRAISTSGGQLAPTRPRSRRGARRRGPHQRQAAARLRGRRSDRRPAPRRYQAAARPRGRRPDRRCAPRQRRAADLRRGLALDRRRDPRRDRRLFLRHYRHRARRCARRPNRRRCRETRLNGLPHNRLPGRLPGRHRGRRHARLPGHRTRRPRGRRPRRRRPPRRRRRRPRRWSRSPRRSVSKAWWPTNLTRTRT